jgi:hypothetical protein
MIVCISPNYFYMDETINSLKYAQKAKKIKENKNPLIRDSMLNTNCSISDKMHIENLEKEIRYLKGILMAKGRNENNPTNRIEESPATPGAYKPRLLSESPAIDTGLPLSSYRYNVQSEAASLEEFDELVEALVENIEDLNALRNNIMEIDALISQTDEKILSLQDSISDSNDYQKTQQLYKELRIIADKLEEHLDLKEHALSEVEKLQQTIKCTKLALRRINISRTNPAQNIPAANQEVNSATRNSGETPKLTNSKDIRQQPQPTQNNMNDPMISSSRDDGHLLEEIKKRDQQISVLTLALKNLQPQPDAKRAKSGIDPKTKTNPNETAWKKKTNGPTQTKYLINDLEEKENLKPNMVKTAVIYPQVAITFPKVSSVESVIGLLKSHLNPLTPATTTSSSVRTLSEHPGSGSMMEAADLRNYETFRPEVPKITLSSTSQLQSRSYSQSSLHGGKPQQGVSSRPQPGSSMQYQGGVEGRGSQGVQSSQGQAEDTSRGERDTHTKPSQHTATFGPSSLLQPFQAQDYASGADHGCSGQHDTSDVHYGGQIEFGQRPHNYRDDDDDDDDDVMDRGLFLHEPARSEGVLSYRGDTRRADARGDAGFCLAVGASVHEGGLVAEGHAHGTSTNPMSLVGANSDRDDLYHEEELEDKRNGILDLQPLNRRLAI